MRGREGGRDRERECEGARAMAMVGGPLRSAIFAKVREWSAGVPRLSAHAVPLVPLSVYSTRILHRMCHHAALVRTVQCAGWLSSTDAMSNVGLTSLLHCTMTSVLNQYIYGWHR